MSLNKIYLAALVLLFCSSCAEGLKPLESTAETKSGIRGVIRFSNRAPADSVQLLFLAGYETPPQSFPNDVLTAVLNRDTLSLFDRYQAGADSVVYEANWRIRRFEYVVVAQFVRVPDLNTIFVRENWRIVGLYGRRGGSALGSAVEIRQGEVTTGIDLTVDFQNPIPLPFESP